MRIAFGLAVLAAPLPAASSAGSSRAGSTGRRSRRARATRNASPIDDREPERELREHDRGDPAGPAVGRATISCGPAAREHQPASRVRARASLSERLDQVEHRLARSNSRLSPVDRVEVRPASASSGFHEQTPRACTRFTTSATARDAEQRTAAAPARGRATGGRSSADRAGGGERSGRRAHAPTRASTPVREVGERLPADRRRAARRRPSSTDRRRPAPGCAATRPSSRACSRRSRGRALGAFLSAGRSSAIGQRPAGGRKRRSRRRDGAGQAVHPAARPRRPTTGSEAPSIEQADADGDRERHHHRVELRHRPAEDREREVGEQQRHHHRRGGAHRARRRASPTSAAARRPPSAKSIAAPGRQHAAGSRPRRASRIRCPPTAT